MKKLIPYILIIALLCAVFAGCKSGGGGGAPEESSASSGSSEQNDPLRVLIDVEYGSNIYLSLKDELGAYMEEYSQGKKKNVSFQTVIENMGGPSSVEIEIPPIKENDWDMYLTSLRTEMMAGGGPDVFVCGAGIGSHENQKTGEYIESEPLFRYPQQAMKRNMFLSLDGYIENAKYMDRENLTSIVMDAGKTEKGQFLLPMTYTVPATLFRKSDVEHTPSKEMKWEDMLFGEPYMRLAAVNAWRYAGSGLAPLGDYDHDKLAISEEDMVRYFNETLANLENYESESGIPSARGDLRVTGDILLSFFDGRFEDNDPIALVPLYSRGGGYGAIINSFAGINANTKRPDEAFWVADYLLGEECQRSGFCAFMTCDRGVPVLEGLMTEKKTVSDGIEDWTMSDNLYEQFCAVRDNISFADFATPLDYELQQLYFDLLEPSTKSRESIIHDAYMRMNMMLAES